MGPVEWDEIEKKSIKIIEEKSKDLRVLLFVSLYYLRSNRWKDFSDIFEGIVRFAEESYDKLFPQRPRARQLAFKWISEPKYSAVLDNKKLSEKDHNEIQRLVKSLSRLKEILEKYFPDGSPFPSGLFSFAQKWEKEIKPKQAESAESSPGTVSKPAEKQEKTETPKQANSSARKAAQFLIEKEPEKSTGYRLIRCCRWDIIEKEPPSENGTTQLPPPNKQQRDYHKNLLSEKNWETLLKSSEKAFASSSNHLWLDLQRYSATACKTLGEPYNNIYKVICLETAWFTMRLPDLVSLKFSDGSPFCDNATKDWIKNEVSSVLKSNSETENDNNSSDNNPEDVFNQERKKINEFVSAGEIEKAVIYSQNCIRQSGSERDIFIRSIQLSSILISENKTDIACSILESLNESIDRHKLDIWNPELSVEVWKLLSNAYQMQLHNKPQNIQKEIYNSRQEILNKIYRTDPVSALKITK